MHRSTPFFLIFFFLLSSTLVAGIPPIASEFYGRVLNNTGTNISLVIKDQSGTACGSFLLVNESFYGLISCKGDDAETGTDEGPEQSEELNFYLNNSLARAQGNTSWNEGSFHEVNVTKAEPPVFSICPGAEIPEDGNGSQIQIDLYNCTTDPDDALNTLAFIIQNQSNSALINCSIASNRYVTCQNPSTDAYGNSSLIVKVTDPLGLFARTNFTINVTSVPDAPRFLQNFTNIVINESNRFTFKVNCSDPEGDNITYAANSTSLWPINSTNGLINVTPAQSSVGNHSILVNCSDSTNLSSTQKLNITVLDINNAPVLENIPPQVTIAGELFRLQINATDADGDALTFTANTSLFEITSDGLIQFIPTTAQIGVYDIFVLVTDGQLNDSQTFSLRIVQGPFCGDGACGDGETCQSCDADCGTCPVIGGGGAGGGGGSGGAGGGGGSSSSTPTFGELCVERWECSLWSPCSVDGKQIRTCLDLSHCPTPFSKPLLEEECSPPSCTDRIQNQQELGIDCGGPCSPCTEGTCNDGILNQNEEEIDCGGQCISCFAKNLALVPILEKPFEFVRVFRLYPWFFLLLALLLILIALILDKYFRNKLHSKEFDEYLKRIKPYIKKRHRYFMFVFSLAGILIASSLYIYYYSFDQVLLVKRLWILGILYCITPFIVSIIIHHYDARERRIQLKFERARELSTRGDDQILTAEQKSLAELEDILTRQILTSIESDHLDSLPPFYEFLRLEYHVVTGIIKLRRTLITPPDAKPKIQNIQAALSNKFLSSAAKTYVEFDLLLQNAKNMLLAYQKNSRNILEEIDFVLLIQSIKKDIHFTAVLDSNARLKEATALLYNVADALEQEKISAQATRKSITTAELEYIKNFQLNDMKVRPLIEGNAAAIKNYNKLVQVYNSYDKNIELATTAVPVDMKKPVSA